jgi:simple sugar transport system permease protein
MATDPTAASPRQSHATASAKRKSFAEAVASPFLRPEFVAVLGTIAVFVFFALDAGSSGFLTWIGTTTYLDVAANVGILAAPVTLLLIAGEFDLSVGAAVGTVGIVEAYPVVNHHWPFWAGFVLAIAVACLIGLVNGLLVVYSKIPSFLVTLAMMWALQGATLALTKQVTNQTFIAGIGDEAAKDPVGRLFAGSFLKFPVSVWWWLAISAVAIWVLHRTRFGNWIYAVGGSQEAAVRSGVAARRVKVVLFMATTASAVAVATLSSLVVNQADVNRGPGMEFQAVVAAVIGGGLIAGGAGSPVGTIFGALLFGMVSQGFFFTNIDSNWFLTFLGIVLLMAVAINQYVRGARLRRRVS